MSIILIHNGDDTKISSSIKDLSFFGTNFEQLKDSKVKYSVRIFIQIFIKYIVFFSLKDH
jgi:hypothetical protein